MKCIDFLCVECFLTFDVVGIDVVGITMLILAVGLEALPLYCTSNSAHIKYLSMIIHTLMSMIMHTFVLKGRCIVHLSSKFATVVTMCYVQC